MVVWNCTITSWKHAGVPKGDGRPALGSELVPSATRAMLGSLDSPTAYAVQTASARAEQLDLLVRVNQAMLTRFGIEPKVGDRLTVNRVKAGGADTHRVEIVRTRPSPTAGLCGRMDLVVLELKIVRDGV